MVNQTLQNRLILILEAKQYRQCFITRVIVILKYLRTAKHSPSSSQKINKTTFKIQVNKLNQIILQIKHIMINNKNDEAISHQSEGMKKIKEILKRPDTSRLRKR